MKTEREKGNGAGSELRLELKYCERCGGLWLRPGGGGQIYCADCARAIAELPASSGKARMPRGPQWAVDQGVYEDGEDYEGMDLDEAGGVA